MNTNDEKAALREHYRQVRLENKEKVSFDKILEVPEIQSSTIIASYYSYSNEPDTTGINRELLSQGKQILLPRIHSADLEWCLWDGDISTVENKNGIYEPIGETFTNFGAIDCIIVPALAVDNSGTRLGKGKGFYDRALVSITSFSVALIYSNELSTTALPSSSLDMRVNAAQTPEKLFRFS
jgi:5-formyltetrahydrofolate cyclo-ligase